MHIIKYSIHVPIKFIYFLITYPLKKKKKRFIIQNLLSFQIIGQTASKS